MSRILLPPAKGKQSEKKPVRYVKAGSPCDGENSGEGATMIRGTDHPAVCRKGVWAAAGK